MQGYCYCCGLTLPHPRGINEEDQEFLDCKGCMESETLWENDDQE